MRRAKSVIDIDIAQIGQLPAEFGVILGFAGVETQIFQQQDLTRLQPGSHGRHFGTNAVRSHEHLLFQQRAQMTGHGLKRKLRGRSPFGPPQMGADDQRGPTVKGQLEGRQALPDTIVIDDCLAFQRHIVVDTNEHSFPAHVYFIKKTHIPSAQAGLKLLAC